MNPVTIEEAMPTIKMHIEPLEDMVFNEFSRELSDFINRPELLQEYKETLRYRINFTTEVNDFISDLIKQDTNNKELEFYYNRYVDCLRQLKKIYNRLFGI